MSSSSSVRKYAPRIRVFSSVALVAATAAPARANSSMVAYRSSRCAGALISRSWSRTPAVRCASTASTATSTTAPSASTRSPTAPRSAYGISRIARYTRLKNGARTAQLPATPTRNPPWYPPYQMNCTVCSAPALPIEDACVFCHAPLVERDEPDELLDYLVERIPIANVRRGHLNRGPITEISIDVDGRSFHARVKNEALELAPAVELAAWVDRPL